jgi:hydrogenase maturation protease
MSPRILIAGVGNVFFGDDGFGVAVARALALKELPSNVVVRDVGIRGLHLAYELIDGWDLLVAIDAVSTGGAPGTLRLIEPDDEPSSIDRGHDAHGMDLRTVLRTARSLGASLPSVRIVGCEVKDVAERIGLTPEVERAVPEAARMVEALVHAHAGAPKPAVEANQEICS